MTVVETEIPDALAGERIDRVVAMVCDLPRSEAADLVRAGKVAVDGVARTRRSDRVLPGQRLRVEAPDRVEVGGPGPDPTVAFEVVYEDADLAVIDKPPGLVVHPGAGNESGTLVHGLLARYPEVADVGEPFRPGIVHRLDRDTSGLLVVARTAEAHLGLSEALARRDVTRRYRTLVFGHVAEARGQVDAPIGRSPRDPTRMAVVVGGREARTSYEVVARRDQPVPTTELVCLLETGRTHQIRVHLQAIGHAVVGDTRYGGDRSSLRAPRQFLHAEFLGLDHPRTGDRIECTSALPADLAALIEAISAT